jgi:hypothetical protein
MSYLVIGFIPERSDRLSDLPVSPLTEDGGVHTPLRQDGYYGSPPIELAEHWRKHKVHPRERVVVVRVVDELPSERRPGIRAELGE